MSIQYKELFKTEEQKYIKGSPVIIEAGALLMNASSNQVIAQLKLRNISGRGIISCKANIRSFEPNGIELGEAKEYIYLDLEVPRGGVFGTKTPLYLPDNKARSFDACITEVVFEDKSVWTENLCQWNEIPRQKKFDEICKDDELIRQFDIATDGWGKFIPQHMMGINRCVCGFCYLDDEKICYNCGYDFSEIVKKVSYDQLVSDMKIRLEKEEQERIRIEAETKAREEAERKAKEEENERISQKKAKAKRARTIALVVIAAVLLLSCAVYGIRWHLIPFEKYTKAGKYVENGNFDEARDIYDSLGNYKDSSLKSAECGKYMIYIEAKHLFESGEYDKALRLFSQISGFEDSDETVAKICYQKACDSMDKKDYKEASFAFGSNILKGYEDSEKKYIEASYLYAESCMESGMYDDAETYYQIAAGYEDADKKLKEAQYLSASELLSEEDFLSALHKFDAIGDYKDSRGKINDAKYGYVLSHKNCADSQTYDYLKELMNIGYGDAAQIFRELYRWRLTFTAVNNSETGTVNMSQINKAEPIHAHYVLTGGEPGSSTTITLEVKYPDKSSNKTKFNEQYHSGSSGCFHYLNGVPNAKTGTLSMRAYDSNGNIIGSCSVEITDGENSETSAKAESTNLIGEYCFQGFNEDGSSLIAPDVSTYYNVILSYKGSGINASADSIYGNRLDLYFDKSIGTYTQKVYNGSKMDAVVWTGKNKNDEDVYMDVFGDYEAFRITSSDGRVDYFIRDDVVEALMMTNNIDNGGSRYVADYYFRTDDSIIIKSTDYNYTGYMVYSETDGFDPDRYIEDIIRQAREILGIDIMVVNIEPSDGDLGTMARMLLNDSIQKSIIGRNSMLVLCSGDKNCTFISDDIKNVTLTGIQEIYDRLYKETALTTNADFFYCYFQNLVNMYCNKDDLKFTEAAKYGDSEIFDMGDYYQFRGYVFPFSGDGLYSLSVDTEIKIDKGCLYWKYDRGENKYIEAPIDMWIEEPLSIYDIVQNEYGRIVSCKSY